MEDRPNAVAAHAQPMLVASIDDDDDICRDASSNWSDVLPSDCSGDDAGQQVPGITLASRSARADPGSSHATEPLPATLGIAARRRGMRLPHPDVHQGLLTLDLTGVGTPRALPPDSSVQCADMVTCSMTDSGLEGSKASWDASEAILSDPNSDASSPLTPVPQTPSHVPSTPQTLAADDSYFPLQFRNESEATPSATEAAKLRAKRSVTSGGLARASPGKKPASAQPRKTGFAKRELAGLQNYLASGERDLWSQSIPIPSTRTTRAAASAARLLPARSGSKGPSRRISATSRKRHRSSSEARSVGEDAAEKVSAITPTRSSKRQAHAGYRRLRWTKKGGIQDVLTLPEQESAKPKRAVKPPRARLATSSIPSKAVKATARGGANCMRTVKRESEPDHLDNHAAASPAPHATGPSDHSEPDPLLLQMQYEFDNQAIATPLDAMSQCETKSMPHQISVSSILHRRTSPELRQSKQEPVATPPFSINKSGWISPGPLKKIHGKPPIWASNRQEICESLPYFRQYHGGHHVVERRTLGYLLDGCPSSRDEFADEGRVIISHCGGGSQIVSKPGEAKRLDFAVSQTRHKNHRIEGLDNCIAHRIPVALLAGRKYAKMPWLQQDPDVAYVVLGWYLPTHIWAERENYDDGQPLVRFKVRFQWLSCQDAPWWLEDLHTYNATRASTKPEELDGMESRTIQDQTTSAPAATDHQLGGRSATAARQQSDAYVCPACSHTSPRIFIEATCLNEYCARLFMKASADLTMTCESIEYHPSVLVHRPDLEGGQATVPQLLTPPSLEHRRHTANIRALAEDSLVGTYCGGCGRLSRRIFWGVVGCDHCHHEFNLKPRIYTPAELPERYAATSQRARTRISFRPICKNDKWLVNAYPLPDGAGVIYHAVPTSGTREADALFQAYQIHVDARSFKRNKLTCSKIDGLVGQQYTLNCGEPYKFCTAVNTVPWADAPHPTLEAQNLLNSWLHGSLSSILTDSTYDAYGFNEVLSCCYVGDGTMKYHSDDEPGVGPIVASLSLGSSAVMRFKPKPAKRQGTEDEDKSLPVLSLFLRHGDVVVQAGANLQDRWLHAVATKGFRIACTARHLSGAVRRLRPIAALAANQSTSADLPAAAVQLAPHSGDSPHLETTQDSTNPVPTGPLTEFLSTGFPDYEMQHPVTSPDQKPVAKLSPISPGYQESTSPSRAPYAYPVTCDAPSTQWTLQDLSTSFSYGSQVLDASHPTGLAATDMNRRTKPHPHPTTPCAGFVPLAARPMSASSLPYQPYSSPHVPHAPPRLRSLFDDYTVLNALGANPDWLGPADP